MQRTYLFIDGNYLEQLIQDASRDWFDGQLEIDYEQIGHGFTKVFYYDAMPVKKPSETEDQFREREAAKLAFFKRLKNLRGWHVHEGISRRGRREPAQQKEVDVLIAVDMLTHTHRKNMDSLTFIAGDTDFRPLIDAVVRDGMYVNLWYGPRHVSEDLKDMADATLPMDMHFFHAKATRNCRADYAFPVRSNSVGSPHQINGPLVEQGFVNGQLRAAIWTAFGRIFCAGLVEMDDGFYPSVQMEEGPKSLERVKRMFEHDHGPFDWRAP